MYNAESSLPAKTFPLFFNAQTQQWEPGVMASTQRQQMGGLGSRSLGNRSLGSILGSDIDAFIKKAQSVVDSAPAAMAAIPGIQKNTDFIKAAIPPLLGAILLLTIAIVVTNK
jgi:hypothetical protein